MCNLVYACVARVSMPVHWEKYTSKIIEGLRGKGEATFPFSALVTIFAQ